VRRVNPPSRCPRCPRCPDAVRDVVVTRVHQGLVDDLRVTAVNRLWKKWEKMPFMPCQEKSKDLKEKSRVSLKNLKNLTRYCKVTPKAPHLTWAPSCRSAVHWTPFYFAFTGSDIAVAEVATQHGCNMLQHHSYSKIFQDCHVSYCVMALTM